MHAATAMFAEIDDTMSSEWRSKDSAWRCGTRISEHDLSLVSAGSGEDWIHIHIDAVVGDKVATHAINIATGQANDSSIQPAVVNRHPRYDHVGVLGGMPD